MLEVRLVDVGEVDLVPEEVVVAFLTEVAHGMNHLGAIEVVVVTETPECPTLKSESLFESNPNL